MSIVTSPLDSVATSSAGLAEPHWQQSMRRAVRDPVELCRRLELPASVQNRAAAAARTFPVFVPLEFLARMRAGDPHDPLLRQVLPLDVELAESPGFDRDPVADANATIVPGLLQKYQSRALLVTSGACAVHCRYCFRRHFPYDSAPNSPDTWRPAVDRIAADPSIDEVILSGGDPLMLVDARLADLVERLAAIGHLRRLRVHTRLPVMIPSRVTEAMLDWLLGSRLTPVVVMHANHARELDEAVAAAAARLVDAGIVVLNQSVLLRGVNDTADALVELSNRLLDLRVMPYYLHQLDRVAGAAHFEVLIEKGVALIKEIRARLPGYAVPRYVQEVPGDSSKRILA